MGRGRWDPEGFRAQGGLGQHASPIQIPFSPAWLESNARWGIAGTVRPLACVSNVGDTGVQSKVVSSLLGQNWNTK